MRPVAQQYRLPTQDVTYAQEAQQGAMMADDNQAGTQATEQQAQPVQTELPIQVAKAAPAPQATPAAAGPDPVKLAEMMAENKTMRAKIAELTAAQGQEAQQRRESQQKAQLEKHRAELEALQAQATAASASAKRNAVKAHFKGQLKSDDYLGLVPSVEFTETGDLSPESVEQLDQFRQAKPELFVQASSATTPMSQSGQTQNAHGFDSDTVKALQMSRVALPGTPEHWANRQNAGLFSNIVGHNSQAKPYGKLN